MAVEIRELTTEEAHAWFAPQIEQGEQLRTRYSIRPGYNSSDRDAPSGEQA